MIRHLNRTEPTICQATVLLFSQIHEVRHWFCNKIHYVHCIISSLEKHWRTCKRVALPNWAIALVRDILIYIISCQDEYSLMVEDILWSVYYNNIPITKRYLLIKRIRSIIDRSKGSSFVVINCLLNSVVRVLLSYGGSHWFKSNSR